VYSCRVPCGCGTRGLLGNTCARAAKRRRIWAGAALSGQQTLGLTPATPSPSAFLSTTGQHLSQVDPAPWLHHKLRGFATDAHIVRTTREEIGPAGSCRIYDEHRTAVPASRHIEQIANVHVACKTSAHHFDPTDGREGFRAHRSGLDGAYLFSELHNHTPEQAVLANEPVAPRWQA
jgi:hypothetical protein